METIEDGKNIELEKASAEAAKGTPVEPAEPLRNAPPEPPSKRFVEADGATYYEIRIDVRYPILHILGFLQNEACDYLKALMSKQMREAAEREGIIKPGEIKKAKTGRFNIF